MLAHKELEEALSKELDKLYDIWNVDIVYEPFTLVGTCYCITFVEYRKTVNDKLLKYLADKYGLVNPQIEKIDNHGYLEYRIQYDLVPEKRLAEIIAINKLGILNA